MFCDESRIPKGGDVVFEFSRVRARITAIPIFLLSQPSQHCLEFS
ncbi:hypothetical protein HMPREF9999_02283 [Alloprevotella sp. oral taxon 473 str. F0040]|nr:hypothetical protein HMPREF9999_02283 [Alloprevotella sp. oral taxon 473 str. F0040]